MGGATAEGGTAPTQPTSRGGGKSEEDRAASVGAPDWSPYRGGDPDALHEGAPAWNQRPAAKRGAGYHKAPP